MPELFAPSPTCAAFQPKCSPTASQRERFRNTASPKTAPKSAVLSCARFVTPGFDPCRRANASEVAATAPAGPTARARNCRSGPRTNSSSPAAPTASRHRPKTGASLQSKRIPAGSHGTQAAHWSHTADKTSRATAAPPAATPQAAPESDARPRPRRTQVTSGCRATATMVTLSAPSSRDIVLMAIALLVKDESSMAPASPASSVDTRQKLASKMSPICCLRRNERVAIRYSRFRVPGARVPGKGRHTSQQNAQSRPNSIDEA